MGGVPVIVTTRTVVLRILVLVDNVDFGMRA